MQLQEGLEEVELQEELEEVELQEELEEVELQEGLEVVGLQEELQEELEVVVPFEVRQLRECLPFQPIHRYSLQYYLQIHRMRLLTFDSVKMQQNCLNR